tara:strand:+ start:111 stop:386 length:276 start_codon:yes stop_codon:yes gene_type:complete
MVRIGHNLRKHYKKTTTNVIPFVLPYKDKIDRSKDLDKIKELDVMLKKDLVSHNVRKTIAQTRTWEIKLYGEVSEIVLKPTFKLVIKKEVV